MTAWGVLLMLVWSVFAAFAPEASPEASAPPEVVRGIRSVATRMESAIRRADSGAYMVAVDTADPVFAEEQRKWARDLRTRPVASADVRVMAGLARPGEDLGLPGGVWVAPIWIGWTLPDDDKQRSAAYLASFRPLGLMRGDWVFGGRVWEQHPADGVRLLIAPDDADALEMAAYLADHVGRFRASVETELGATLPDDPTIKIYPDMGALQASIALSYTDALGGWNEPGESIKLLSRSGYAGPRLDATVAHELGHAVSFEWGERVMDAPWWSLEGIAEVCADPFRGERFAKAEDAAIGLARAEQIIPFERLADFRGEAMRYGRQVYVQGRSMVGYIGRRFGRERRNQWFRAMGAGRTLEEATREVLEISFDRLETEWRGSINEAQN